MTIRVLVVDDDLQELRALRVGLTASGYELLTAGDGATGLEMARKNRPDVVVIELALPDMHGTDVIAGLRDWSKVPIIAVRGPGSSTGIVEVLDAGADECMTTPFDTDVLMARLRALRRRAQDVPLAEQSAVQIGHFSLDLSAKTVIRRADAPRDAPAHVHLTKTEWAILEILVRSPGAVVPGARLMDLVWGASHVPKTHHLRFHMVKLRHKLEPEASRPRQLITEPGVGYRFQP